MSEGDSTLRPKGSRAWAPRPAIAPKTRREDGEWVVASNGSEGCYGGWEVLYPAPKAGEWVRFSIQARWQDLERGYDSVNVALTWLDERGQMVGWEPVFPQKFQGGHVHYEGRARVPARKGAEILCLPIMGDHRASTCFHRHPHDFDIERWLMIQRMRAMDNHVYMVVSRNWTYGTGIFSPRGETLAVSGGRNFVWADVDLEDLPRCVGDATFRGMCWYERREPAYGALSGELMPDPFTKQG
ncbi:MAG: hypothetical protein A3F84_09100 [Candidatus Handelsmanbacteria bacterium RIFCSPLOWO2_12_FULL_64_10]|uniref:Uncharacterized protein n=1 Tax=Handelsmanbacteria sp. (strain RIFCSPLOWO2_12_FULL_64_10) TaxID=1817868 RepID=A0A1F6CSY1_HANXR|nr:MAG: hypothetical protein A3F84_09100 [Candidatus Handelsmanbacteria bacterium RIFCSPLOWO2_12_FULL_64_10]